MTGRRSSRPLGPGSADILVVDDMASVHLSLQAILGDIADHIVCVTSGAEALRALLTRTFGLIILDFQLPDMNGLEAARLIRARGRCKHIPIIFLTGYSYDEVGGMDTVELGAIDFLLKPVHPEMLRAKVAALLSVDAP
jgi:CheY-like chemotaxis protein